MDLDTKVNIGNPEPLADFYCIMRGVMETVEFNIKLKYLTYDSRHSSGN